MRLVRISVANSNPTVGRIDDNVRRAVELCACARDDGASLVVLPEGCIGGYPPEDLVQWSGFVAAQWRGLEALARATADLGSAVAAGLVVARGDHVYNAAALVLGGRIWGVVPKEKLPLYNVFYEARTYASGRVSLRDEIHGVPFGDLIFDLDVCRLALEVCEDAW